MFLYSLEGDTYYTNLVGLLQKLQTFVSPKAGEIVQNLIVAVQGARIARNYNDVEAASVIFADGANEVKKLLPELTDEKLKELYSNVEIKNLELIQKLASNDIDNFDYPDAFIEYIDEGLGRILSEESVI